MMSHIVSMIFLSLFAVNANANQTLTANISGLVTGFDENHVFLTQKVGGQKIIIARKFVRQKQIHSGDVISVHLDRKELEEFFKLSSSH